MRPEIIAFLIGLGLLIYYKSGGSFKLKTDGVKLPSSKWLVWLVIIVFGVMAIWVVYGKYTKRQVTKQQTADLLHAKKNSGKTEVKILNIVAYSGQWRNELIPVEPGFDMTFQTVPEGLSVEVIVRDENGDEYDTFSLNNERGVGTPSKVLTPGKKFFLDFWSNEPRPVEMVIFYFPKGKNKLVIEKR
ncbi:hypothetical protein L6261_01040 [Candidatus Parcubacteria bacterium]|nr:hypothetical protein [Candidatus Parcubacteria bacterium]